MSTPQASDCLIVGRGGGSYSLALSDVAARLRDDDRIAISRGGQDWAMPGSRFKKDGVLDSDLIALGRNGIDYKCSGADYNKVFGIAPLEIESVSLQLVSTDSSKHKYHGIVRLKSTGPRPTLPPGISWQYISVWKYRSYFKLVRPDGTIKYARTFVDQPTIEGYYNYFWGPSDHLYENTPLSGPSYVMYTGELNYYTARQQWRYFKEDEPRYWESKSFTYHLDIPNRWNYWNDGELPKISVPNWPVPIPDQATYNNDTIFPPGTTIQLIMEIYNDFGARTHMASNVLTPARIGPAYPY